MSVATHEISPIVQSFLTSGAIQAAEDLRSVNEAYFDAKQGLEAKEFGKSLLAADSIDAALELAKDLITEQRQKAVDDPSWHTLPTLVKAAQAAGVLAGRTGSSYAIENVEYAQMLDDDGREQVGYAISKFNQAKSGDEYTPWEMANYADSKLKEYQNNRSHLTEPDNTQLVLMAYASGLCMEDPAAAGELQKKLDDMITDRTIAA